ncbi:SPOR domain-containing protein [Bacteroidota bacterium]
MIKFYIAFCLLLLLSFFSYSQENIQEIKENNIFEILSDSSITYSQVSIHQDEFIKELVLNHIKQNKKQKGILGYRINIFFDSGYDREGIDARTRARAVKDTFDLYYPHISSYLKYETPNYKVYIGDFRTKTDATKVLKALERYYPKAFIINDRIDYLQID